MAILKPSISGEIEDIQHRMAQIRHDMHGEVLGAVKGARLLADWRSLVGTYPWLTLGAATAIGYFLVPARRSATPTIVTVNPTAPEMAALLESQQQSASTNRKSWSITGTVFSLVAPIAVRAAQSYALQYVERLLAERMFPPEETERDSSRPYNPARSTAPAVASERLRERH
jgi:hypothetical protein